MTLPRRPPIALTDAGMEQIAKRLARLAPGMELGWSMLKAERNQLGYRTRIPDGDRRPSINPPEESDAIDYADHTGDMAVRLENLSDDLDTLQSHRHLVETSLAAIEKITARYRRDLAPAEPLCAVRTNGEQCGNVVEKTRDGNGYRGCVLVEGVWCVRPSSEVRAVCAGHRKLAERKARESDDAA